jgi:hypothetical protein
MYPYFDHWAKLLEVTTDFSLFQNVQTVYGAPPTPTPTHKLITRGSCCAGKQFQHENDHSAPSSAKAKIK